MSEFTHRAAVKSDLPRLLEMEQHIIAAERPYDGYLKKEETTYYDLNALIDEESAYLLVVELETRVVGCGYARILPSKQCHQHEQHCYLGFIYVEPSYRGNGIAQQIVSALTQWGVEQEVNHFYLDVYVANESAVRAYEKYGFAKVTTKMELVL